MSRFPSSRPFRASTGPSRRRDLHHDVVFNGSGKLGLPENALLAMATGCTRVGPTLKSVCCAHHLATLRFELLSLARARGQFHPGLEPPGTIELLDVDLQTVPG